MQMNEIPKLENRSFWAPARFLASTQFWGGGLWTPLNGFWGLFSDPQNPGLILEVAWGQPGDDGAAGRAAGGPRGPRGRRAAGPRGAGPGALPAVGAEAGPRAPGRPLGQCCSPVQNLICHRPWAFFFGQGLPVVPSPGSF